jgi:hypothetical protein
MSFSSEWKRENVRFGETVFGLIKGAILLLSSKPLMRDRLCMLNEALAKISNLGKSNP